MTTTDILLGAVGIVVVLLLALPWIVHGLTTYYDYVGKRFK